MSDLSKTSPSGSLESVLREAFEGAPEKWSYFTDPGPESAFLWNARRLSASEASRLGSPGAPSAAHVHHVAFSLGHPRRGIRGERCLPRIVKASWSVSLVDDRDGRSSRRTCAPVTRSSSRSSRAGADGEEGIRRLGGRGRSQWPITSARSARRLRMVARSDRAARGAR